MELLLPILSKSRVDLAIVFDQFAIGESYARASSPTMLPRAGSSINNYKDGDLSIRLKVGVVNVLVCRLALSDPLAINWCAIESRGVGLPRTPKTSF